MTDDDTAEFDTKEEAVLHAISKSDDGDLVTVHEDDCEEKYDLDCTCQPTVIVVKVGQA